MRPFLLKKVIKFAFYPKFYLFMMSIKHNSQTNREQHQNGVLVSLKIVAGITDFSGKMVFRNEGITQEKGYNINEFVFEACIPAKFIKFAAER